MSEEPDNDGGNSGRDPVGTEPDRYVVVVGNLGTVYSGNRLKEALETYSVYRRKSADGDGRVAGEPVALMDGGEIWREWRGETDELDLDDEEKY